MNDQLSSQAPNVNPIAELQSNVLKEENWLVQSLPYTPDVDLFGFLQLCADRRFHSLIQAEFQKDAKLKSPEDYWIHADAGGTPKMECQIVAPDYCYYEKKVRLMGWAAHGAICGGFGPNVPDDEIQEALLATVELKKRRYKDAEHFVYFVTTKKEGDTEETLVYSMVDGKGSD